MFMPGANESQKIADLDHLDEQPVLLTPEQIWSLLSYDFFFSANFSMIEWPKKSGSVQSHG